MATKAKTLKARITVERVHALGSNQKELDFVRTPTMCQLSDRLTLIELMRD